VQIVHKLCDGKVTSYFTRIASLFHRSVGNNRSVTIVFWVIRLCGKFLGLTVWEITHYVARTQAQAV